MMEHSSVALRWMGLGFHQLYREEREMDKQGSKERGDEGAKKGKMRVGMKEQRGMKIKIYAKLLQRSEGIQEAGENIEYEVISRAPCQVMMCSAPSLWIKAGGLGSGAAGWGKSVAWPLTQSAWSQFMKASSYTPTCVPVHIRTDLHIWAPFWFDPM